MPLYEYRCEHGHVTERVMRMTDEQPETITCVQPLVRPTHQLPIAATVMASSQDVVESNPTPCGARARRLFNVPAAIHFKGAGFYSTDVKGRVERRRRPNPGDDLATPFDTHAAAVARDNGIR